jgi:hypothetical protein
MSWEVANCSLNVSEHAIGNWEQNPHTVLDVLGKSFSQSESL